MAELVQTKAIISGDVIEITQYEHGYLQGYEDKLKVSGRKKDYISKDYKENRKRTLRRARSNLIRTINSNFGQYGEHFTSKFLTLTFEDNIQDIEYANNVFKKFIKRLNYYVFKTKYANLKYSAVIEFQERGAIHYHLVLYNLPYVPAKKINEIWNHGNINIKKIDHVDNVGAYVCKYMSKDNDDPRLEGQKCYFNARDLKEPIEITDKKKVDALLEALPLQNLKYKTSFEDEYLGTITYYQFNISYFNDKVFSHKFTATNTEIV